MGTETPGRLRRCRRPRPRRTRARRTARRRPCSAADVSRPVSGPASLVQPRAHRGTQPGGRRVGPGSGGQVRLQQHGGQLGHEVLAVGTVVDRRSPRHRSASARPARRRRPAGPAGGTRPGPPRRVARPGRRPPPTASVQPPTGPRGSSGSRGESGPSGGTVRRQARARGDRSAAARAASRTTASAVSEPWSSAGSRSGTVRAEGIAHQGVLAGPAAVDRRLAHPGPPGHGVQRAGLQAALAQQVQRGGAGWRRPGRDPGACPRGRRRCIPQHDAPPGVPGPGCREG